MSCTAYNWRKLLRRAHARIVPQQNVSSLQSTRLIFAVLPAMRSVLRTRRLHEQMTSWVLAVRLLLLMPLPPPETDWAYGAGAILCALLSPGLLC